MAERLLALKARGFSFPLRTNQDKVREGGTPVFK
jgi:hypothetical protein